MNKKIVTGITLTLLVIGMLPLTFNIQQVKAEPITWTIGDSGSFIWGTPQDSSLKSTPESFYTSVVDIIHPQPGQFAHYFLQQYISPPGIGWWNTSYNEYVQPHIINTTHRVEDPYGNGTYWCTVDTTNRWVTDTDPDAWWNQTWWGDWIETNVTVGSVIGWWWANATIVGSETLYVVGRDVDCWVANASSEGSYSLLYYDKLSGLLVKSEDFVFGGELGWEYTLNATNIISEPRTWTVDDDGPADFSSIQEAINLASEGDMIYVYSGTYYEHVVVNKRCSLIGEDRTTTIIDGNRSGTVVSIKANDTIVSGFTIQNSGNRAYEHDSGMSLYYPNTDVVNNIITNNVIGLWIESINNTISNNIVSLNTNYGIYLDQTSDNNIIGNIVFSNTVKGIYVDKSSNNNISDNTISGNEWGIYVRLACNNFLRNNNVTGNMYNLFIVGGALRTFVQDIDSSNTVDGKPVYYWVNKHDSQIPSDAGYVAVINSTNITVKDLNITRNGEGVLFAFTTSSIIENVNASNNGYGIYLLGSSNNIIRGNALTSNNWDGICLDWEANENTIVDNTLRNNSPGIGLFFCNGNTVFHNNFIDNSNTAGYQATFGFSLISWDNGYPSGGNYWSDYTGIDGDNDGIGDTPYVIYGIDENDQDNYPLIEPWSPEPPSPVEATQGLIETIETWELPKGTENSLKAKLKVAIHMLDMGKEDGAIRKLTAFINRVEMLREKTLTNEQADELVSEAQRIIDLINGWAPQPSPFLNNHSICRARKKCK